MPVPAAFLVVLLPAAWAGDAGTWLPEASLLPPALADTTETVPSLAVRSSEVPRIAVTLGESFGIYRLDAGSFGFQGNLGAGLFVGFTPGGEMTFDMLTADGVVRLSVAGAHGPYRVMAEWSHLSAHFADGLRSQEDRPLHPCAFSRESLRLLGAWTDGRIAPYAGFTELLHAIPEAERPGFQLGWSSQPRRHAGLYHAFDLKTQAELDWKPSLSAQVGLLFRPTPGPGFRVGLSAFAGPDDTGQLWGQDERYIGGLIGFVPPQGHEKGTPPERSSTGALK
jgi:hypothetical protein